MLNSEARETSNQMVGDFPRLGKTPKQTAGRKTRNIFNHFNQKKEFIMANESKIIQIGSIALHGLTNDAHF